MAISGVFGLLSMLVAGQAVSTHDSFSPYTSCNVPGGPQIVDVTPLAPGVDERTVPTLKGQVNVSMSDGRRIMFAYPGEDFYANIKVEILPANDYADSKTALIDNFEYVLASSDNLRNYKIKPKLDGFEVQGLDRSKREGGVLGMYLLFDDATHTVITIYFLNQEPPKHFKTMEEYAAARDHFLNGYFPCVRTNLASVR